MSDMYTGADDVGSALERLDTRLTEVEDTVSDPTTPVGAAPTAFPASGFTIGTTPVNEDVLEVTALTLTTESFLGDNVINISWPDPGDNAVEFEVEVARYDADLDVYTDPRIMRTFGTGAQMGGFRAQTVYGVRIWSLNSIGRRSDPYPLTGFQDITTDIDTTIPSQATGVVITRGATTVVVQVDEATDVDVAEGHGLYEYQIDTANTFSTGNLHTKKDSAFITAFASIVGEAAWWARVRYIDEYGNEGAWSTPVGPTTAGGVTDSMVLAGLSAAKITVGLMSGDRIDANTASIGILKTSSLTTADITLAGGSLKAGTPPTTGLLINSQGLRLYSGGVATVILDVSGTVTVTGNINATGGTLASLTVTGTLSGGTISGASVVGTTITGSTVETPGGAIQLGTAGGAGWISFNDGVTYGGSLFADGASVRCNSTLTADDWIGITGGVNGLDVSGNMTCQNLLASGLVSGNSLSISSSGTVSGNLSAGQIIAGTTSTGSAANCFINGSGVFQKSTSVGWAKSSIQDMPGHGAVLQLRARRWKSRLHDDDLGGFDDPDAWYYGAVAEEVHAANHAFATHDDDGVPDGINWPAITMALVERVKIIEQRLSERT